MTATQTRARRTPPRIVIRTFWALHRAASRHRTVDEFERGFLVVGADVVTHSDRVASGDAGCRPVLPVRNRVQHGQRDE